MKDSRIFKALKAILDCNSYAWQEVGETIWNEALEAVKEAELATPIKPTAWMQIINGKQYFSSFNPKEIHDNGKPVVPLYSADVVPKLIGSGHSDHVDRQELIKKALERFVGQNSLPVCECDNEPDEFDNKPKGPNTNSWGEFIWQDTCMWCEARKALGIS